MAQQGGPARKARPRDRKVAQWSRDYVRLPGIPDEFIGADGQPRAVWSRYFDACSMPPARRPMKTRPSRLISITPTQVR